MQLKRSAQTRVAMLEPADAACGMHPITDGVHSLLISDDVRRSHGR